MPLPGAFSRRINKILAPGSDLAAVYASLQGYRYTPRKKQSSGDGLLVYFGYPQADEEDPERVSSGPFAPVWTSSMLSVRSSFEVRYRSRCASGLRADFWWPGISLLKGQRRSQRS